MKRLITACVVAAVLTGCQSTPKQKSFALAVAYAGGIGNDLKDAKVRSNRANDGKNKSLESYQAAELAGVAAGAKAPPPGVSRGASVGILALGFLANRGYKRANHNRVFAWLPKANFRSMEDAQQEYERVLVSSLIDALPTGYITKRIRKGDKQGILVIGPGCAEGDCWIGGTGVHMNVKMIESAAPKFLGGYDAYEVSYPHGQTGLGVSKDVVVPFDLGQYYARISERLPGNYFYYSGMYKGLGYPVVFHQGQPHYFIQSSSLY